MDPLSALKEFVAGGQLDQVVESGSQIDFGGRYSYDKAAATAGVRRPSLHSAMSALSLPSATPHGC